MMSKTNRMQFSYKISGQSGPMFKPESLHFFSAKKESVTSEPFQCMSDALVGLSARELVQLQESSFFSGVEAAHTSRFWETLDVSHQLFRRMEQKKQKYSTVTPRPDLDQQLQKDFSQIMNLAITAQDDHPVIDIRQFSHFVDIVDKFEAQFDKPLVYNFEFSLSPETRHQFQVVYSFLFHLRSLIVLDYNSHVEDKTNDSLKMDRITNYLPNPEYVVNDAVLWAQISKTLKAWKPESVEDFYNQVLTPCKKLAKKWIHNGYHLQANTPKDWYDNSDPDELQDELYNAQMQWLLASDAGLLFRIREEAYGVSEGYDRIFYPDASSSRNSQNMQGLKMYCELDEGYLKGADAA